MRVIIGVAAALMAMSGPGTAQTAVEADDGSQAAQATSAVANQGQDQAQEQDSLKIYFTTGSSFVGRDQRSTLDQAARLFREGSPIVMIVAGGADTVGQPSSNLDLSIRRALAVADGLVARGIPADRLQVLGRGNSELVVETDNGVASPENRTVEITWR